MDKFQMLLELERCIKSNGGVSEFGYPGSLTELRDELVKSISEELRAERAEIEKKAILRASELRAEDKNAFSKKFETYEMREASLELFGDPTTLMIGDMSVPNGRKDLSGRCLLVGSSYNVDTFPGKHGSTVIEITKK